MARPSGDVVGEKRKRGVKPAEDYMNIAVDNLENLYIEYAEYPYKKGSSEQEKKERARRRNEISALESRISKKIGEMQSHQEIYILKNKLRMLTNVVNDFVNEENK